MMRWLLVILAVALPGCGGYRDTFTLAGTANFHVFLVPQPGHVGMYRTGLPQTQAGWDELRAVVEGDNPGHHVTRVYLHDWAEGKTAADPDGTEIPAARFGWTTVDAQMPPEDDKPLTIFEKPNPTTVARAVTAILDAHAKGDVVVWGCVHDRDRGGLVSALVGRKLFGWSKAQAWRYAIDTGLRWELPDLDAYWLEDVNAGRRR